MKQIFKNVLVLCLTAGGTILSYAQENFALEKTALGKIEPYEMEVTYDKTSHIIFPTAIRYVDLGSGNLIAGKADDAENVLRVKAAVKDFQSETNLSVITDDGRFYNFDVTYMDHPAVLNIDLLKMRNSVGRNAENEALFEDLSDSPSLVNLLMETIYKQNKRNIKHIGSKSFGIQFLLKGIYTHNGKYYFHTELKNKTNVPFVLDFMSFKIVDKKIAKRTVIQENLLSPLRTYIPLGHVSGKAVGQNVFLLDQFTIADDKVLLIEIFEKNGGRHQVLRVENSELVKAQPVKDMHLKFY